MEKRVKFKNTLISVILLISMIITMTLSVQAANHNGTCGANLTWTLDTVTGVLTISGTGPMTDYTQYNATSPWYTYRNSIKVVNINSGVTSIGNYAFYICTSLTSITLPDSVTSIGNYAFYNCSGLTSVTLPDNVTSIGNGAFYYCFDLTSVTLPDGITTIREYTFYNCTGLTSVTLPDNVTSIGNYAFYNCTGLTSVTLPDNVTSIGNGAFKDCYGLTSVTLPDSMVSIGNDAFYDCTRLTSITLPDNIVSIGNDAFCNCTSLTSITLPDSVVSIGKGAFSYCTSLTNIIVYSQNEYYSSDEYGVLFNKDKSILIQYPIGNLRTEYNIPDSVTTIGYAAFGNYNYSELSSLDLHNSSLTNVTISNSVTTIEPLAFDYCIGLTNVIIPESVTSIGDGAFYNCTALISAIFNGHVPDTFGDGNVDGSIDVFDGTAEDFIIYYYKGKLGWTKPTWTSPYGDVYNTVELGGDDNYEGSGTFTYASGNKDGINRDYEATYHYYDSYFSESSYLYNQSLGTMSLCLAMSAFGSAAGEYEVKSQNARKLLNDIGFDDDEIETNQGFEVKPKTDSIGVIAANKPITVDDENFTLIAVAIRGGGYEREWAGNFALGSSGDHKGFSYAKNEVILFLKYYIAQYSITGKVKLWITGYSRAAATANLVAGEIDNGIILSDAITYDLSDVYTYCFETPAGTIENFFIDPEKYDNIFNILNKNDPVVYASMGGFTRYGVPFYLPTEAESRSYFTEKLLMLKFYNALPSTSSYLIDDFQMKKISLQNWLPGGQKMAIVNNDKNNLPQSYFLATFISNIVKNAIINRSYYNSRFENDIREAFYIIAGNTPEQMKIFEETLNEKIDDNFITLVYLLLRNLEPNFNITIYSIFKQSLITAGINPYDDITDLNIAIMKLANRIWDLRPDIMHNINYYATLKVNSESIKMGHYQELCLAWMQSMDTNYLQGATTHFTKGSYRIIFIDNPNVDVNVLDIGSNLGIGSNSVTSRVSNEPQLISGSNLVGSIINNEPQIISGSSIICAINDMDKKVVLLPSEGTYKINLFAANDGEMNFTINESSSEAGDITRILTYPGISLSAGDSFTAYIPAYTDVNDTASDGTDTEYSLRDGNNNLIPIGRELIGSEATSAYFTLNASANNDNYGLVFGQGVYQYGQFAKATAIANEGYRFIGWYDGETKISSENEYGYFVETDVSIVAKFIPAFYGGMIVGVPAATFYTITATALDGGIISPSGSQTVAPQGSKTFSIVANNGYIIDSVLIDGENIGAVSNYTFDKINSNHTITASFKKINWQNPFTDVFKKDKFYNAVEYVSQNGLFVGTSETTFAPKTTMTRAMFVTVLGRLANIKANEYEGSSFGDVPIGQWYSGYVEWASANGIILGLGNGNFEPDMLINHEQMYVIIKRYADYIGKGEYGKDITLTYRDKDLISDWALNAVLYSKAYTLTDVNSFGNIYPKAEAKRSEVAMLLYSFSKNVLEK